MAGPSWEPLQRAIDGEVVVPASSGYEDARKPAIARFHDARPAAVVRCRAPEDVAETLAFARANSLPTTARSGGHCFAGRSSTTGIVIDVGPLADVSLSGDVATIGAGARLGAVYDALAAHGRTIAAGCGPEVGIAGLVLGGGLGILGRTHGTTSDQLLGAQVVLPDGRIVGCDEQHDADLFWALRGAGADGFGIATSFAFRTVAAPPATSFRLDWPRAVAVEAIDAWQQWAPDAPDELAASLLVTPSGVHLFGAMLGDVPLDPFVASVGADPESSHTKQLPYRETKRHLVELGPGDADETGHVYCKSEFFEGTIPRDAIAELVRHGCVLDFSPWGGAYNRTAYDATAFVHRSDRFLLKHEIVVEPGADRERLQRSWQTVHPYGTGRSYQNFPDPDLDDEPRAYYGANLERLRRQRSRWSDA